MSHSHLEYIINWMEKIEKLDRFSCSIEPDYYGDPYYPEKEYGNPDSPRCYDQFWQVDGYYPIEEMEFNISDTEENKLIVWIPLDGISSTHIYFKNDRLGINIEEEVDISIIDSIKKLIERFPDNFFSSEIHAALFYSSMGNIEKAIDYMRLYFNSEYQPYKLSELQRFLPIELTQSDEFRKILTLRKPSD